MEQSVTSVVEAVRASGRRVSVTAVCRVLVVDMGLRNCAGTRALALAAVQALGLPTPKDRALQDKLTPGTHSEERAERNRRRSAERLAQPEAREKHQALTRENSAKVRASPVGRAKARAATQASLAKWRAEGRAAEYYNARYRDDPAFRLRAVASARILGALRNAKRCLRKSAGTVELLGCSVAEFMAHLEAKFAEGMTWDNHGTAWHVDHVVPVVAFDLATEEGQRAAFHYTNCQPLWAEENLSKGSLHGGVRHRHGD